MSRKEANGRVLELIDHFGTNDNSVLSVEYFFYANREDDANNLAIELSKLGYRIYGVDAPDVITDKWSITGVTPKMDMKEKALAEWADKMEELAEENNAEFDGWGTLLDSKED